ncbi:nitrite reductase small subunit NirD [Cohnella thailandensis]|uniref:nitrite reductase small subunit NirD n=1 Tax=Cohnella thailandensis TaxID=557557 RepID=UPI001E043B37|nr:nitrite reductase (NADH) small subunit [Cohnella thailandensis]
MINREQLNFAPIGGLSEFPRGLGRQVRISDWDLAVFRTTDGALYALENRTPHPKGGPLAEGIVSGHYVYCPLRDWKIDLEDGEVQEPDTGRVRTFPVRIEDEAVLIGLPSNSDR